MDTPTTHRPTRMDRIRRLFARSATAPAPNWTPVLPGRTPDDLLDRVFPLT